MLQMSRLVIEHCASAETCAACAAKPFPTPLCEREMHLVLPIVPGLASR
jgi:hypothetical protein